MKRWQLFPAAPVEFLADNPEVNPLIRQLLFNRGLVSAADIKGFLTGELDQSLTQSIGSSKSLVFFDPFLFRDMERSVDIIIGHIKAGNRIVVYGDYDTDGVTSSVILLEAINILHGQAEVYLPDRITEGYGLNKAAINQIAEQGFKLIITVDNGVRNKEEVAYAKSLGLDVIVTDHHVLPEDRNNLPDCPVIDPADSEDKYPWPFLAGVGVSFKLVSALLLKANLPDRQKQLITEKCLDLVAIGTIADMVSLLGENRLLVQQGMAVLNQNRRLGLNELIKISKINGSRPLEAWNVGWQIGPRLNAASRMGHANSAFELLRAAEPEEASQLAIELNQRNISRQQITEEIVAAVEKQINPDNLPSLIIGLAGEDQFWNEGVIGLVAGRITEKYYRPTLIITRLIEEAEFDGGQNRLVPKKVSFKGSGRSIEEFNLIAAVEDCASWLEKYGGHPMACGFSLSGEDNLAAFSEKIQKLAWNQLATSDLQPKIMIEAELFWSDINLSLVSEIINFGPYGQNNPQPRFVSYNLRIDDIAVMGFDNQHIKLRLSSSQKDNHGEGRIASFWALAFGGAGNYRDLRIGDQIDLVYYLEINEFGGRREPQLKIIDLRPAAGEKI